MPFVNAYPVKGKSVTRGRRWYSRKVKEIDMGYGIMHDPRKYPLYDFEDQWSYPYTVSNRIKEGNEEDEKKWKEWLRIKYLRQFLVGDTKMDEFGFGKGHAPIDVWDPRAKRVKRVPPR